MDSRPMKHNCRLECLQQCYICKNEREKERQNNYICQIYNRKQSKFIKKLQKSSRYRNRQIRMKNQKKKTFFFLSNLVLRNHEVSKHRFVINRPLKSHVFFLMY